MSAPLKRIGIPTGGGDCPGLNAVIRSIAKPAMSYFSAKVIGILDGFEGLLEGHMRELTKLDVSGIVNLGGTILGTSNKGDPFRYPIEGQGNYDYRLLRCSDRSLSKLGSRCSFCHRR